MSSEPGTSALTICIPTYNRAELLKALLDELDRPGFLPFAFDVVVLDNASTDPAYQTIRTFAAANYHYRYFRRPENIGFERNQMSVYRLASAELCLQLSDDDSVIADELASIVAAMRADPEILATYALWQGLDLSTHQRLAYQGYEDMVVRPGEAAILAACLSRAAVPIPEHAVFRTDGVLQAIFPGPFHFGFISLLQRLLQVGAVRFSSRPFYLLGQDSAVLETLGDRASGNLGFYGWGRMAQGWAAFNHWATGRRVFEAEPSQEQFIYLLLYRNAAYEAQNQGRPLEALQIVEHIQSLSSTEIIPAPFRASLLFAASIEAAILAAADLPGVSFLHMIGLPAEIEDQVRAQAARRSPGLVLKSSPFPLGLSIDGGAFLTATDLLREQIIRLHGALPGYVFSLESLRRAFGY